VSQSCNSSSVSTDDRTAEGISTVSVFMVTVYHGFRLNVSVLSGMASLSPACRTIALRRRRERIKGEGGRKIQIHFRGKKLDLTTVLTPALSSKERVNDSPSL
jgi:hypothetical protein